MKSSRDGTSNSRGHDPINNNYLASVSPKSASDSEDLPEPSQLLHLPLRQNSRSPIQKRSSSSEYSDPDFDHALENVDLQFLQDGEVFSQPPINILKRSLSPSDSNISKNKRIMIDHGPSKDAKYGSNVCT
jgi:hypothetical protein